MSQHDNYHGRLFQSQEVEVLERSASEPDLSTVNEDSFLLRDRTGQSIFTSHQISMCFCPGLSKGSCTLFANITLD